jgi:hypothetical protein
MDGGGALALIIFCGLIVLLFPRDSKTEKPRETKPEAYIEIPQGQGQYPFAGGYPGYPYQPMGYPQINPVTSHTVGGNRILRVGDRLYIQQQLPGTGNGGDENG